MKKRVEERRFLSQLINGASADQFNIPVIINAKLRPYQREGVSWLAFLNRYGLHGVLADGIFLFI